MSEVEKALDELRAILVSKNSDYKIDGEFSNFEYAGSLIGNFSPLDVMMIQVGIKLGRIKGLASSGKGALNEPLIDSFRDLAGYTTIAYAYIRSVHE